MTHRQPYKWKETMEPKRAKKKPHPKRLKRWGKKCEESLDRKFGKQKTGKRIGFMNPVF